MKLTWLILLGLLQLVAADPISGPGRTTLVEESWGSIYCAEGTPVQEFPGGRRRLETPRGPIWLSRSPRGWLIQAPNQVMRVDALNSLEPSWRFIFNASQYRLQRDGDTLTWSSPNGQLSFDEREEGWLNGQGAQGRWQIRLPGDNTPGLIASQRGETRFWKGEQGWQAQGLALAQHPELYRGVVLDNEEVGMHILLPPSRALPLLGWDQVLLCQNQLKTPPPRPSGDRPDPLNLSGKPFQQAPELEDTLKQKPGNEWSYPEGSQQQPKEPLQSISAPKGTDPFKPRSAPKGTDPLKAVQAPKGSDPLNLNRKPFQPAKTQEQVQNQAQPVIKP